MALEEQVERVRGLLIKKMGGKSYLRPQGLVDALAAELDESSLTVRQCMGRLAKEGWLDGVAPDGVPFRQVRILGYIPAEPPDPDLQRWQAVLDKRGVAGKDRDALASMSTKLSEFSDVEQGYILDGLVRLRANFDQEAGRHRFLVSAEYLLGSSKLLDMLPAAALRSFGISIDAFPTHPLYVVVAGCPDPRAVVLVENPAAFELAVSTGALEQCAFVATFGFGLSKSQEDYGNQLAWMVEDRFAHAITLKREGAACPTARELLNHPRIMFWGDLDIAGVQIFLRLKQSIPALRLSALYRPMMKLVESPAHSHPYVAAAGKSGQARIALPSDLSPATQKILSLCATRGVDQEIIKPDQIEGLASKDLDEC